MQNPELLYPGRTRSWQKLFKCWHGMDPKSLKRLCSHSIRPRFVMGTVSEEMSLSVVSYALMSPDKVLVGSWQPCFASLSLLSFRSSIRTLDLIVPSFSALIIVSENLCPFALILVRVCLGWQRKSYVLDNPNYTRQQDTKKYSLWVAMMWISPAGKEPSCRKGQCWVRLRGHLGCILSLASL